MDTEARRIYTYDYLGVCDRIAKSLLTCAVCQATHRLPLIGWPINDACRCRFERLFSSNGPSVSHQLLQAEMTCIHGTLPELIQQAQSLTDERILLIPPDYLGHDYGDFDEYFQPSDEVASTMCSFMARRWRQWMVGLHIRRTDKMPFQPPPLENYMREVDRLLDIATDAGVFLATDDPAIEPQFTARYGKRLVSYPVRTLSRNASEGIIDAVIILYLLRNTHGVVGSQFSGYSLCAGWHCGFVDVPSGRCINHGWTGQRLVLRPPILYERAGRCHSGSRRDSLSGE